MKISTILSHIDSGYMALPEFQRGFVWNRDQVRGLMDSLYRRHPVGTLLVWTTQSKGADKRGDADLPPGVVKLLLDGQQRITSLYGITRGKKPQFFEGNPEVFTGLFFHLEDEEFGFYQPIKMADDPLWIDVTALMKAGNDGLGAHLAKLGEIPELAQNVGTYAGRLSNIGATLRISALLRLSFSIARYRPLHEIMRQCELWHLSVIDGVLYRLVETSDLWVWEREAS